MAKNKCRDCKECRRSGLGKMFQGTIRVGAAVLTYGGTEVVARTNKALLADVCPICGHRMNLHTNKDGSVAG